MKPGECDQQMVCACFHYCYCLPTSAAADLLWMEVMIDVTHMRIYVLVRAAADRAIVIETELFSCWRCGECSSVAKCVGPRAHMQLQVS
jgi:hypothetical protein